MAAHPHVCGEHRVETSNADGNDGSSPRVWGALTITHPRLGVGGLIPTCVGSTWFAGSLPGRVSAHPHVCGEHFYSICRRVSESGSSPRVWGALLLHLSACE